ncbi:hypothetical protein [Limnobacter sp.]|uniref:hypothetical protein n=1 Tax=Limnobacter sp. TaxID=2003368 RepID=UPI002FE06A04
MLTKFKGSQIYYPGILLAISACTADPTATQKSFVYENFVGEGRPEYKTTANQIELRESPDSGSAIANKASISKEQALTFEHAITRTLKAGQIELQGNLSIQVREFGEIDTLPTDRYYDESITWVEKKITANDKPTLLMWMAEGNCLITIKQTVNESNSCPIESDRHWKLTSQPTTESWIQVKISDSKGWVKVDGQQIKEVSRGF